METKRIRALIVEDNPGDFRLLKEMLKETKDVDIDLHHAGTLNDVARFFGKGDIDVVLLDLDLPDSSGINTFENVNAMMSDIPIIILTGKKEEDIGRTLIKKGAQDYLVKGEIDGRLVLRSIRYSIERKNIVIELRDTRKMAHKEKELYIFDRLSKAHNESSTSVTARLFGQKALSERMPENFNQFARCYSEALDGALENILMDKGIPVSKTLQTLAKDLGLLKARPKDVIDIHTKVLKDKIKDENIDKIKVLLDEARLMVLETMGYLASYYRNYVLGVDLEEEAGKEVSF